MTFYRPAGSLQAELEQEFPQTFIGKEPLSGVLTLVVFGILSGAGTIHSIGQMACGINLTWRKAMDSVQPQVLTKPHYINC